LKLKHLNNPLWGFSIALSWTWGLGLFFSVQMAIQFGLAGLLAFAIPNAIGLAAFGWFAQYIADKFKNSLEFEKHFLKTVGELRWIFLLYQVTAIALTFFALFKYVFVPLDVPFGMIALIVLGAALLLGEQFDIKKLKWSHFVFSIIIILCILMIGVGGASYFTAANRAPKPLEGETSIISFTFLGFFFPILVGFLLGPWLDVQQWQRAIQIRREGSNIRIAYIVGGLLFFGILLFHGTLALSLWAEARSLTAAGPDNIIGAITQPAPDGLFHVKDAVVRFLFLSGLDTPIIFRIFYILFLILAIISTLDSGYVALKWFQTDALKKSESVLLTLIPKSFLESPMPPFLIAALIAMIGVPLNWQLEYFMSFYGAFSVGYALVFLFRTTYVPRFASFTQTTLVSLAFFSLGIFGVGYFEEYWFLMAAGAVIPIIHASVSIATRKAVHELSKTQMMERAPEAIEKLSSGDYRGAMETMRDHDSKAEGITDTELSDEKKTDVEQVKEFLDLKDERPDMTQSVDASGSTWLEGKSFCHTLMPTYQDTNSVGNVYFAQYSMWVGKTRELFFNFALPDWDIETTTWYVLTRSYEHKFIKETTEFNKVTIKLRISGVNRKFVTMEHQIFDSEKSLLGKGKQVLLFVNSSDYRIVDIPKDCYKAFLPYL